MEVRCSGEEPQDQGQHFGSEKRLKFLGGATSGMGFGEELHKQSLVPAVEVGNGAVGLLS